MRGIVFAVFSVIIGALAAPSGSSTCPNGKTVADGQCCVWFDVLDDIQANFFKGGKCGSGVHKALRLVFHDSIGISPALEAAGSFGGGGADGSIIAHSAIELAFPQNGGLGRAVEALRRLALTYGVSFADIVQFASSSGISNCPGAPRLEFLAGRSNSSQPSPPGLVPGANNNVDTILARMGDAGFSAEEIVHLLASHSIADQQGINPTIAGSPFDSTPAVFDTQFYIETSLKGILQPGPIRGRAEALSPLPGELRMNSDDRLARDPRTACTWQSLADNSASMVENFRAAMIKLSLLGQDRATLVDCSEMIPIPAPNPKAPSLPAGKTMDDIESSCPSAPFPVLPTVEGPIQTIPADDV